MLDLLDNLPRLRLSDDHLKAIIWVMKECGTPAVPSFYALRKIQKKLTEDIGLKPTHHTSTLGNQFYMNHPNDLIRLVSRNSLYVPAKTKAASRTLQIHSSGIQYIFTLRSPQRYPSFGKLLNMSMRWIWMSSRPCGPTGICPHIGTSTSGNWHGAMTAPSSCRSSGLFSKMWFMWKCTKQHVKPYVPIFAQHWCSNVLPIVRNFHS